METVEGELAVGLGRDLPGRGCWSGGSVSESLLGGALGRGMPSRGEVTGEGMVWEGAMVEVGGFGCVEGGVVGAETSIELGGMQYRAILITSSLVRYRA